MKFNDIVVTRELLDILHMVPPLYHLNRAEWPKRKEHILRYLGFRGFAGLVAGPQARAKRIACWVGTPYVPSVKNGCTPPVCGR